MVLTFVRGAENSATYTIFGKLPGRADFLRINASHPVAREFDDLLSRGLDSVSATENWNERYDKSGPSDFFYTSRDGRHAFIGVMHPSRDSTGRRYPLIAGVIVASESIADCLPVLPIAYELFFSGLREQLASGIENSVEMIACRQFLEDQITSSRHASADLDLARELLARFQQLQSANSLGSLLSNTNNTGILERSLINIGFSLELSRRFTAPTMQQLIMLPLPESPTEDAFFSASWLMIYMAFSRQLLPGTMPGYFVSHIEGKTRFTVVPGQVPTRFIPALLGAPLDPLCALDLDAPNPPWAAHRLYAEASYLLGRELLDPQATVRRVIEFIAQLAEKIGKP
ncbi:MAG: type VI secretion system-associated protein TagF [Formivibrio sp.]|nr:type VI secretion system-associated protein TagF [Formivibrio sp.]